MGKTIEAIGLINLDETLKKILIICPASVKGNWRVELNGWLTRKYSIGIAVSGSGFPKSDIVIINFDILNRFEAEIKGTAWDLLIVDEAHFIKNRSARRTAMVMGGVYKQLVNGYKQEIKTNGIPARRYFFLTGTPILDHPIDLEPIVRFLLPGQWPKRWDFVTRYCAPVQGPFGYEYGVSNLNELQEILRSKIMVRRLKKDVLKELPAKRRQVIEFPADESFAKVLAAEKAVGQKHIAYISKRLFLLDDSAAALLDEEEYREKMKSLEESDSLALPILGENSAEM